MEPGQIMVGFVRRPPRPFFDLAFCEVKNLCSGSASRNIKSVGNFALTEKPDKKEFLSHILEKAVSNIENLSCTV
jgi:hypothetical protein